MSGLTLSEVGVIIGIVVGVLGLIFGQFWAWKRNTRQAQESLQRQAERELRMSLMQKTGKPIYHVDTDLGKLEATNE